jgi:hypothetical protein
VKSSPVDVRVVVFAAVVESWTAARVVAFVDVSTDALRVVVWRTVVEALTDVGRFEPAQWNNFIRHTEMRLGLRTKC